MAVFISFIVPVYNLGKYLRKNIMSLCSLNIRDVEMIYVNDGSTDGSAAILQEFAEKDKRIRIITQENRGPGAARNSGMAVARGEWIAFVDGDDWLEAGGTERIIREADDESDIICGELLHRDVTEQDRELAANRPVDRKTADGMEFLRQKKVRFSNGGYLYRASFLQRNQLVFPKGLLHEDMEFVFKAYMLAGQVKRVNIPFYRYVRRAGSTMSTVSMKRCCDLIQIAYRLETFAAEQSKAGADVLIRWYQAYLCNMAIHYTIVFGKSIGELLEDRERKRRVVLYLLNSPRLIDRVGACMHWLGLYKMYTAMFLRYNEKVPHC